MSVLMLEYKEMDWWYWLVTVMLLTVGLLVNQQGFLLAIGLTVIQLVHYRILTHSFWAFPVQVRIGYLLLLIVALLPSMQWLYWIPYVGTWAKVFVGYCAMARLVSLLPWYRSQPLSFNLLASTFLTAPVQGSVLK